MKTNRKEITHEQVVAELEAADPAFSHECEKLRPQYEFRSALIGYRIAAGWTQRDLAERLGMTQSVVARLESGARLPTVGNLHRIAAVLGVEFIVSPECALSLRPIGQPANEIRAMAR
ncbi:MAG: helix-turn-helix transcriptional regulator [Armatimonadetes bacterium]|nr:helix-turn-helix transcriptional regulator [Armatimonadota bacterium]